MTQSTQHVVIIGAGPYGLAAAAHLRSRGVETRVFGKTMSFWQRQMPVGMLLRSAWDASHIADPDHALTLDAFQAARGIRLPVPVPLDRFIEYGQWFQRQVVPDLDPRTVTQVEAGQSGFRVMLEDGEAIQAARVVIATGLSSFHWRPAQFRELSPSMASHASEHRDLARFRDQRVIVIGAGQSALESAALLHEAGAEVEVIARRDHIRWLRRGAWLRDHLGPVRPLLYPSTDVGPIGLNWIVAIPELFNRLPLGLQRQVAYRSIAPAGAAWLIPRLADVPITTGRSVVAAHANGNRARLTLDNGEERRADHVLLGTGYQVNVRALPFLAPTIVQSLRCVNGYPDLGTGFEASVAGLHFLGAPAAESFGPLMRFVSGSGYAARHLTRHIAGKSRTVLVTIPAHQTAWPTNGTRAIANGRAIVGEQSLVARQDGGQ